jgi:hypothetical protein
MTNETFSEPYKYVLQNWTASRQLEVAMENIRQSYSIVGQRVVDAVCGANEEFDFHAIAMTQHWGPGSIVIGKKAWGYAKEWASGYSFDNLRLEILSDETAEPPTLSIWFSKPEKIGIDKNAAIKAVHDAAKQLLTKDEIKGCKLTNEDNCALIFQLPQSKNEILEMLIRNDSQEFVDCLVNHFELVTKFTPVMDKIFSKRR